MNEFEIVKIIVLSVLYLLAIFGVATAIIVTCVLSIVYFTRNKQPSADVVKNE